MAYGTGDLADIKANVRTSEALESYLGGVLLQPSPKFCSGTPQSNKELMA